MSHSISVRPGLVSAEAPNDLAQMHALDIACFEEPFRFSLANLERYVRERAALTFVAECAGRAERLAGFVVVQMYVRARSAYVVTLDVDPELRRCGIAALLMRTAEAASASRGVRVMHLHVHTGNTGAVQFYEQLGYLRQSLEPDLYGAGLDAWVYGKAL